MVMGVEGTKKQQSYIGAHVHDLKGMVIFYELKTEVKVECNFLKVLHYAAGKRA